MIKRAQIRRDDPRLDFADALNQDLPRIARAVCEGRATALDATTRGRLAAAAGVRISDTTTDLSIAKAYLAAQNKDSSK